MRSSAAAAITSSLALAVTLLAVPAHANQLPAPAQPDQGVPEVVADGLAGPLTLAVGDGADLYVTQSFVGLLSEVDPEGTVTDLYQMPLPPGAGQLVGVHHHQDATYHIETDPSVEGGPVSHVIRTSAEGQRSVISEDLRAYETSQNPDQGESYGFRNLSGTCAEQVAAFQEQIGVPTFSEYQGVVEANPYQLDVHEGTVYIAEASGNAVLRVDEQTGEASTVAVLPSTTITFTEELEANVEQVFTGVDMPDCVVGQEYTPEPVPTDVEVGPDGQLYVSTLEGAAGEVVPLSKVYRIDPSTGSSQEVASGMHGATGLALDDSGNIFVAELYGGEVSVIRPDHQEAETVFAAQTPADVEVDDGTLYATTGVFENGAVVEYPYAGGQ